MMERPKDKSSYKSHYSALTVGLAICLYKELYRLFNLSTGYFCTFLTGNGVSVLSACFSENMLEHHTSLVHGVY